MLRNDKFKQNFMLNYKPIQNGMTKAINKSDKDEAQISSDLDATQTGIDKLKNKKGGFLSKLIMGGAAVGWIVVGGLILVTLFRLAFKKWKKTYMPETNDKGGFSILGFKIPGFAQMKSIGLGLYNFFTIGLVNHWTRLSKFFKKWKDKLFGKQGAFGGMRQTMHTLRRIGLAWAIGQGKKVVGGLAKALSFLVSFIPGWGPALAFLIKFIPAICTFFATQIMLIWSKKKMQGQMAMDAAFKAQGASGKNMVAKLTSELISLGKNLRPFVPLNSIPGLQTPKGGGGKSGPNRSAIMRRVDLKRSGIKKDA